MELNGQAVEGSDPALQDGPEPQKRDRPAVSAKSLEILHACKWKDMEALRALSSSDGGLLSDELRCQAWPLLLGNKEKEIEQKDTSDTAKSWRSLVPHRDEDQVRLDVERSFIYYPDNQSPEELDGRKEQLSNLITEVLRRQSYLCYFQGYHDICQVFLLVLQPRWCVEAVARLSALRIRDFMLPTLAPALTQLRLIPAILRTVNPRLYHHLSQTQPFFALSGTLTMYAHDIQEYGDIARLFDVLLAREAVFSVYLFAQIILQRADELFDTPADEPEMLHSILSKLPKPLDLEALISGTIRLFEKHPPETLQGWWMISSSSVLKTTRLQDDTVKQTLQDGELFFERQVKELQWAERREKVVKLMWRYRKPASALGLAILLGVLSQYFKRPGGGFELLSVLQRWSRIWRP